MKFYLKVLSITAIILLGIIVYFNSLGCSFHFDDFYFILKGLYIRDISNLQNIWDWWPCRFITFLSLAFSYHFYQFNVVGYHLFNIGIHLASAVFVWWLLSLTFSTPVMKDKEISRHAGMICLFTGLIFVSHPVQTQAVTFIWQRAASMAALFYLAALCFYIKSRILDLPSTLNQSRIYYICSLITGLLAMFTKETAITLPLMLLLYEVSFLKVKGDFKWKPLLPFLAIFFTIPIISVLSDAEKFQSSHSFVTNIPPTQYFLTEVRVIITYMRLALLPIHQNLDYDYTLSKSLFAWPTLLSFVFLVTVLFFTQRLFAKYRLLSFSILWFFLALVPESSIFPFADVIFEHRLYLPMVGGSIFLVTTLYYILGTKSLRVMAIALIAIIAVNSFLTYQRNKIWKNEYTLWKDVTDKSPHKARPHLNFGRANALQGNSRQALVEYSKAIAINPKFTLAYYYRGNVYEQLGNFAQAMSDYNKAIGLVPNFADMHMDRGVLYAKQGDLGKALSDFNQAIALNPNLPEAYNNRARAYYRLKNYDKAWEDVRQLDALGGSINPVLLNDLKKVSRG